MASLRNGHVNGHVDAFTADSALFRKRFADVPNAIDIYIKGGDAADEAVELDLVDLPEDATELCDMIESEGAGKRVWMTVALAYAKQKNASTAIDILKKGLEAMSKDASKEKLPLLSCLCWLYLWKSREAPRVASEGKSSSEAETKDFYLQASTATLNDASRINPAFPPLFLARGVLYLLRASLVSPTKTTIPGSQDQSDRIETLKQAMKCFEEALRVSGGRNMMALMGKSRVLFSLGRFADSLQGYQEVLKKMPNLTDPDPRIGIGCCFWQLGFKDDAKGAWERALEVNPSSPIASVLLGIHLLASMAHMTPSDPEFRNTYTKAITQYIQKSYKINQNNPLACAALGNFLLARKGMAEADKLARMAIELTDINAIASDGWYLLAKKEHYGGDIDKARDCYRKADDARGGEQRGYLPAKFGLAQVEVLKSNIPTAEYLLEKMAKGKNVEAMALLGTIYADAVFQYHASGVKDEKAASLINDQAKKAIANLEGVRIAWKDPKKSIPTDTSVLLNLARLYEVEYPEKSLACLKQVEQIELVQIEKDHSPGEAIAQESLRIETEAQLLKAEVERIKAEAKSAENDKQKADVEAQKVNNNTLLAENEAQRMKNETQRIAVLREYLPPQLLNNMGCFHYRAERFDQAREMFQTALTACVKAGENDEAIDSDALVTSISFNLARTYEAAGMPDEAKTIYQGLLQRHAGYTDASARLAYIALKQDPTDEGPRLEKELYNSDPANLDVRALHGWFLHRSKRRMLNPQEDPENRHYKHTLQQHDKHDRYSLTGMGNILLAHAREMRRDTEADKDKRRKQYSRAVEFFIKGLLLDPQNAYAAQGIAIALSEDKRDFPAALKIFSQIRDTLRDASVSINLGHTYAELKRYQHSIDNYETALAKDRTNDPQILACLGRVWLLKGKTERNVFAMRTSLDYARRALESSPEQTHFRFNVAFVQIQIAQLIHTLPEGQRVLKDLVQAATDLDEAIEELTRIANEKDPPYPKHDIEQRANMGRNTMRKQLERAVQAQTEYEEKNKEKLRHALEVREREMREREEERRKAELVATEQARKLAQEREKMRRNDLEKAREYDEQERLREDEEYIKDPQTGERRKRPQRRGGGGGKRKKKEDLEESADEGGDVDTEGKPKTKKRKLQRKSQAGGGSKFKSAEIVVDSESGEEEGGAGRAGSSGASSLRSGSRASSRRTTSRGGSRGRSGEIAVDSEEGATARKAARKGRRVVEDDDEDDEDGDAFPGKLSPLGAAAAAANGTPPDADTSMGDAFEPTGPADDE